MIKIKRKNKLTLKQKKLHVEAEQLCNMGLALQNRGQIDEALKCYIKSIELNPQNADPYTNLGSILQEKEQISEAIKNYEKALQLMPENAAANYNLGSALHKTGQLDKAIPFYKKALQINPNNARAFNNLGTIFQETGKIGEALDCYRRAVSIQPDYINAISNLGSCLKEKGQIEKAIASFKEVIKLNPEHIEAHYNMSIALLLAGNLKHGFDEYEWRWKSKDFLGNSCVHHPCNFSEPVWDGSPLNGKLLLLYTEQGVGDEIMYSGCFQDIINQDNSFTVECDKRLIPIFSRSFPQAIFTERAKDTSQLPPRDMVMPVGSLPKFFRTDFSDFPDRKSYLIPDAEKVDMWKDRLNKIGQGLKIGISWRGGGKPLTILNRSIELEKWFEILSLPGAKFINLQYGDCWDEVTELRKKHDIFIYDWEDADPLKDLDDFAAQIYALDMVISIDNSTVHMAGALGKTVWVLLPFVPDWRWMLNREDTPWYPTLKLFRQSLPGNWESVITKIRDELMTLLGKY